MRMKFRGGAVLGGLFAACVGLVIAAPNTPTQVVSGAEAVHFPHILSGRVDASGASAAVRMSTEWSTTQAGTTTLQLEFDPAADLRIEVNTLDGAAWVGPVFRTIDPTELTLSLQADTTYRVDVWAFAGASDFVASVADPETRPNILVIMTDDQRRDSIVAMPKTMEWMGTGGTQFNQGYVTTPACCPARAATLTGRYNHNNGVVSQEGPAFDENTSIAKYLKEAGYSTAHIGKYVHYYDLKERAPHWDRWTYFQGGYDNVYMNFDGTVAESNGYSTNIAFDKAIEYSSEFEAIDDERPWLIHVWPTAPHRVGNEPPTPEDKYKNSPVPPFVIEPRTFEADVSDKPSFIYCCPGLTTPDYIEDVRTEMTRSLYSVDDGVEKLLTHLQETGELGNTLVFFLSDNGWMFGDHNLHEKFVPYENSVGVPFFIRWPGRAEPGAVSDRLVSNIDILPTALAAAGVEIPANIDGQDIFASSPRDHRFTEYFHDDFNIKQIKSWAAIATPAHNYIEWYEADGTVAFREFYDRQADPYQLVNLLGDSIQSNDPASTLVASLSAQIALDRNCSGANCP